MKSLSLGLLFLFISNSYAEEVITPNDRFLDSKTGKYVRVCEVVDGELVVKETCGRFWEKFPRKREELYREVKTYKDLNERDLVMIPVKDRNGNTKMVLGKISFMYENGQVTVMEYYSQRFGYSPGTSNWRINHSGVTKLNTQHPLAKHAELCAKEDTDIVYNFDDKRKFSLKKGEKVALKGIFDNGTAAISLYNIADNFLGYGLDNKLPINLSKLEECDQEDNKALDNSARAHTKPISIESDDQSKINTDHQMIDR